MSRPAHQHVFLVPGFFGFAHLGGVFYFAHVSERLELAFRQAGQRVAVHRVKTLPTASIERRAARVLDAIRAETADDGSPIHVVGHSTGGLDARLLATPGVRLPSHDAVEPWASRIRSVVSVATPHHGTPLASFFRSAFGQHILRALSVATVFALRSGRVPMGALAKLVGALAWPLPLPESGRDGLAGHLYSDLLRDFGPERRAAVDEFFREVGADRALLTQLTPDTIGLFNAVAEDREGVRYGSVVACAPPPGARSQLRAGLDPYRQLTHALFRAIHRLAELPPEGPWRPSDAQLDALTASLGRVPTPRDSDGVVPTLSQPWGETIRSVVADHLDVIGHFSGPESAPPHHDWLKSGSDFRRPAFDALWRDVGGFLLSST